MTTDNFSHDVNALGDIKINKMMADYGFAGFGYYWAIVAEIYKNDGRYEFEDLKILSKTTNIEENELKEFIDKCISQYTHKDIGLFVSDEKGFWSCSLNKRMELKKKRANARNKKSDISECIKFDGIEQVNITQNEFDKLCEKYGKEIVNKAIEILDAWLGRKSPNAMKYLGKNHYGHFRSDGWVILEAKKALGLDSKVNWSI